MSKRIDLAKSGQVTLENHNPGKVKVLWSHAYEADGQLIVNGVLKRQDHSAPPIPAHVHVLEVSDNEQIVESLQTHELYVPRNRTGRGNDWKSFEVRSKTMPQPGSRIILTVHTHIEYHTDQDVVGLSNSMGHDMLEGTYERKQ